MKNKKLLLATVLAFVVCIAMSLAGCIELPSDEPVYYTVNFDSRGGSEVESQRVMPGNPVRRPEPPVYEVYEFNGWYVDETATETLWDFETDRVNSDLTLYAGWKLKPIEIEPTEPTASLVYEREGDTYIVKGVGEETAIVIPAEHDGLPVVAIRGDYGNGAFAQKDIMSVVIPDSVTEIGQNAFNNCKYLSRVRIGESSSLAKIGNNAFSGCTSLKEIYLPASVTEIGDSVFNNCGALKNITVAQGNAAYRSENGHLIQNVTDTLIRGGHNTAISEGVKIIAQAAFRRSAITKIDIPASVVEIGDYAFDDCADLAAINVSAANANYASQDGILYNKAKTTLIKVPEGIAGSVTLPNTLSELPIYAFDGIAKLTEVNIPAGALTEGIRFAAFRDSGIIKVNYGGTQTEWEEIIAKSHNLWNTGVLAAFAVICLNSSEPTPEPEKSEVLIAYFSATGSTENIAKHISDITGGDLYKITPAVPYTSADLNYNTDCRANREQNDPTCRPQISGSVTDMAKYDIVFIGYPIWWGQAPKIIYTFLESYNFSGKTVVPFCTSGSSGVGSSATNLHASAPTATWKNGQRFSGSASKSSVETWINGLNLNFQKQPQEIKIVKVYVGSKSLEIELADNPSAKAFAEKLKEGDIVVKMDDYGNFEKVGDLGFSLPRSDAQITTSPGDVILYLGTRITIYYDVNSWNFTLLGKIKNMTRQTMLEFFGGMGEVTVRFSLK